MIKNSICPEVRFLVVRTDFLGDSVLSSTFIRMLHQLPNVKVDVVCFEYNFTAFKYNPDVANKYCLHKNPQNIEEKAQNKEILLQIKQNNYLAVFVLNRDLKAYDLLKSVKSKKIFGHRLGVKSMRSKIFCKTTELTGKYNYLPYDNAIHEVVNQYQLLNFGLTKLKIDQPLSLDQNSYFYTDTFDPRRSFSRDETTVVVNVSGRRDTVRYIPSTLARCIIEDLLKIGKQVLIIATADEFNRAHELLSYFPKDKVQLFSDTDLFKLVGNMAQYLYYIGADGGLLHIAAGLGMHCVGLFHAQNIDAWHPWSKTQICVQTQSKKIYDLTAKEVITALNELCSRKLV